MSLLRVDSKNYVDFPGLTIETLQLLSSKTPCKEQASYLRQRQRKRKNRKQLRVLKTMDFLEQLQNKTFYTMAIISYSMLFSLSLEIDKQFHGDVLYSYVKRGKT